MRSKNHPCNAARFGQGGCTALLAATTEWNQAAVGSATEDDGSDVLNRQPYAQPVTKGAALAAIRTVIPVRSPHFFGSRITGQTTRSTAFRPALSQPVDATQRRLASTTRALRPHTVAVRIPFNRESDCPAFAAGEFVSLGVEVNFTHRHARFRGEPTTSKVQRLPVPLVRPFDGIGIALAMPPLLRRISTFLATESLSFVRVHRQSSQAIEAASFTAKNDPTF